MPIEAESNSARKGAREGYVNLSNIFFRGFAIIKVGGLPEAQVFAIQPLKLEPTGVSEQRQAVFIYDIEPGFVFLTMTERSATLQKYTVRSCLCSASNIPRGKADRQSIPPPSSFEVESSI